MSIQEQQQKFIEALAPHAQEVQRKYGVPASIVIAQAALESGWNADAKTLFGIKADSNWQGAKIDLATHEFLGGKMVGVKDAFRSYGSVADSVKNYGQFLASNRRYAGVLQADNAAQAADELQRAGYATDPQYAGKLKKLIGDYDLTRFDDANYHGYMDGERFETTRRRLKEQRETNPDVWGDFMKNFFQLIASIFSGLGNMVFGGEEQKVATAPLPTPTVQRSQVAGVAATTPPRRA